MSGYDFNGWAVGQRFSLAFKLLVVGYRKCRPIFDIPADKYSLSPDGKIGVL